MEKSSFIYFSLLAKIYVAPESRTNILFGDVLDLLPESADFTKANSPLLYEFENLQVQSLCMSKIISINAKYEHAFESSSSQVCIDICL